MSIIRKLIIVEWTRFFVASFFILFLLITVANLISGFLRGNVTAAEVILNHIVEIPASLSKIFPISCLVASLFSTNKLKNRNELTAIFAAGYSRKKFLYNIAQASLVIALAQFSISSFVQPLLKKYRHVFLPESEHKFRNLKSKGLRASTIGSGKIWYKSSNYYFSFNTFDKRSNSLTDVTLYFFDENYKLTKRVSADLVQHIEANTWKLRNARIFTALNLQDEFPKVEDLKQAELIINENPSDFNQIEADITTLNIVGLRKYIKKLEVAGINTNEYKVMYYDKYSSSIICIIFSLLAAVAIFNPNRRTSTFGKNIFFIFVFTILYWLVYSYFLELGKSSIVYPSVAAFLVPVIFAFVLAHNFYKNRTLR